MKTGEIIKKRRKELKLTADQVADEIGVSRSTVFRYENGDIEKIPSNVLEPLSKVLKTTTSYLMGNVNELPHGEGYTPERVERMLENNPNELEQVFTKLFIEDLEDLSFLDDGVRERTIKMLKKGYIFPNGNTVVDDDYKEYLASNVFKSIKKSMSSTDEPEEGDIKFSKDTQINFLSNYIRMKDPLARDYYFSEFFRVLEKQGKFMAKKLLKRVEKDRKALQKELKRLDSVVINESDQDTISEYEQIIDTITRIDKELENISAELKKF